MLSFVVPVLDEAATIERLAPQWLALRRAGHEVLVVDGGSRDGTRSIAARHADRVLESPRGRARQMNAGAAEAAGDGYVFLHADTRLPPDGHALVAAALARRGWGRFDVRLDDPHPAFRVIEAMMSWRSALTGIATGDQAVFVRASLFLAVGGFPEIALMEDVALSRLLRGVERPARIGRPVVTSARRWRRHGIARTVLLMWGLRAAYALGASPEALADRYERSTVGPR